MKLLISVFWSAGYGPSEETMARIAPGGGSPSDGKKPLTMAKNSINEMAHFSTVRRKPNNISQSLML